MLSSTATANDRPRDARRRAASAPTASTTAGRWSDASYTASGQSDAFLYSDGKMTDLGTLPGGYSSCAYGINDSGQIVGEAETSSGQYHIAAFLDSDGTMTDLGTPQWENSYAYGVNDERASGRREHLLHTSAMPPHFSSATGR